MDARTGIVRLLRPQPLHPHLPRQLRQVIASLADTRPISGGGRGDPVAAGCAWWDRAAATNAALGEAVERYCAALVPARLTGASYAELASTGQAALDPHDLALFSAEQYATPGFPFAPFTRDQRVRWVPGRDLTTGQPTLAPASLIYTTYLNSAGAAGEPRLHPLRHAGLAAGRSRAHAEGAALLELVERDAVHTAWTRPAPLRRVELPGWLHRLLQGPHRNLEPHVIQFPAAVDLSVVGVLLYDTDTELVGLGTACRPDPLAAVFKAAAEAAQLHMLAHALLEPGSAPLRLGAGPAGPLKPWRADRHYRRSYRPDWRDVRDLLCHAQLYLDPSMRTLLTGRLTGGPQLTVGDLPTGGPTSVAATVQHLSARGLRTISVDVTTSEVAACGWHVVRVVAPDLYDNAPAAFPYLGGRRLGPAGPNGWCLLPLPYA